MDALLLVVRHALALAYANAFMDVYFFGYDDADREVWGVGYAKAWEALA